MFPSIHRPFHFFPLLFLFLIACNGNSGSSQPNSDPAKEKPQPVIEKGTFSDGDQTYPTLTLEGLTWLGVNLNVELPESWCYDTAPDNCTTYGRLYRWSGAKEACAKLGEGWRLPTETEWRQLAATFGGYTDWLTEETTGDPVAANRALIPGGSSGFDLPLSGWRGSNGGYDSAGKMGFYWTASEENEDNAWFYIVLPEGSKLTRRSTNKRMGMACRCVR